MLERNICRPDLSSTANILASEELLPGSKAFGELEKLVEYCRSTASEGLRFKELDPHSLRLSLFTDASFGKSRDPSSQIGFLIVASDKYGLTNIIHYASQKCRRATRSVMAAELLALVIGFDYAYVAGNIFSEALGRQVEIDAYLDSKTAFNCVAKATSTTEKRLQIDAASLRNTLACRELVNMCWIHGHQNPSDGLTRIMQVQREHPLRQLMIKNHIDIKAEGWIEKVEKRKG